MSDLSAWERKQQKEEEERGLPRCQVCNAVLLNGNAEAYKERGDIGDWMSLELLCCRCAKKMPPRAVEALRCQCDRCACVNKAVTVLAGELSCAPCVFGHDLD